MQPVGDRATAGRGRRDSAARGRSFPRRRRGRPRRARSPSRSAGGLLQSQASGSRVRSERRAASRAHRQVRALERRCDLRRRAMPTEPAIPPCPAIALPRNGCKPSKVPGVIPQRDELLRRETAAAVERAPRTGGVQRVDRRLRERAAEAGLEAVELHAGDRRVVARNLAGEKNVRSPAPPPAKLAASAARRIGGICGSSSPGKTGTAAADACASYRPAARTRSSRADDRGSSRRRDRRARCETRTARCARCRWDSSRRARRGAPRRAPTRRFRRRERASRCRLPPRRSRSARRRASRRDREGGAPTR